MTENADSVPRTPRLSPEATDALARAGLTEAVIGPNETFTAIAQAEVQEPASSSDAMPEDHYVVD